jgi:hypothetical protein
VRAGGGVEFRLLPLAWPGQTAGDVLMAEREQQDRHIYRRCPACETVCAASELRRAGGDSAHSTDWLTDRRYRCPACGHTAPLPVFERADPPARPQGEG